MLFQPGFAGDAHSKPPPGGRIEIEPEEGGIDELIKLANVTTLTGYFSFSLPVRQTTKLNFHQQRERLHPFCDWQVAQSPEPFSLVSLVEQPGIKM